MRSKFFCLLIAAVAFVLPGKSPASDLAGNSHKGYGKEKIKVETSYKKLWKSVDSLADLGQPRSALEVVTKIYKLAKEDKNDPQILKSLLYRLRLQSEFMENFEDQAIREIREELVTTRGAAVYVLHSILAEVYQRYLQNNAWKIGSRTPANTSLNDSLATWDERTLSETIFNEYLLSLNDLEVTRKIPITSYRAVLEVPPAPEKKDRQDAESVFTLRPTLYDFLAWRALDYFSSGRQQKSPAVPTFSIDDPAFFSDAGVFSSLLKGPLPTLAVHSYKSDSLLSDYFTFRIYQQLTAFHLTDKDPAALIALELSRLEYMKAHARFLNTDSLYRNALSRLAEDYKDSPWSTRALYQMAQWLTEQGHLYRPLESEAHRWEIREAGALCEKAIRAFPGSYGARQCKQLLTSIREPYLEISAESAVIPEKPFPALIKFKNLEKVFFRFVRTDPEKYSEKSSSTERKEFFNYLAGLPVSQTFTVDLPLQSDFQQHATEIANPALTPGFYVLFCSADKNFRDPDKACAILPVWSTRISFVNKKNEQGGMDYFLLDRSTGLPLSQARAEVWSKSYDYRNRQYITTHLTDVTAGQDGFFSVPAPDNRQRENNLFLKIQDGGQSYITDHFYIYPVQPSIERSYLQTFFYTDRAIYRPGQTIWFKGIVVERTGDHPKIKQGQPTTVSFTDVNGQLISKSELITNDFGSFNGSFTAPQGTLNGMMTLSNESGSVSVSVEAYKRPTFEVTFEPMKGNYRLGEKLTVQGKALSYSGSPVGEAVVNYRIVRTARYPFRDWWWFRPIPDSRETEIVNGTTRTGKEGGFTVNFPAIPDYSIPESDNPVFDYRIFTDVTDINGEMQSAGHSVSAGYQSLIINAAIPEQINLSGDTLFAITTTNLNGILTPAEVHVTLKRLQQPERLLKKRLWERPDLLTLSKEEFCRMLPNDLYGDEDNAEKWPVAAGPFEKQLTTSTDTLLQLSKEPGTYLLTLSSVDPFGKKVIRKMLFTAFDPASSELPVQTLNWFVPLKTSGRPGEKARFLIGSSEEAVHLIYEVRRRDTLRSREEVMLNRRVMLVEIPITEDDRGNFTVNFFFIRHNRVFQNSQLIQVPYTDRKLDIAFETSRNKLDPGALETWKIRISDCNKQAVPAEFLAGMYDASLDAFRAQKWSFDLYERYSGTSPWDISRAFGPATGQWFAPGPETPIDLQPLPSYQLNWFGLSMFGGGYRSGYQRMGGAKSDLMMAKTTVRPMERPTPEQAPEQKQDSAGENINDKATTGTPEQPAYTAPLKIRKDFRETAFFFPSLVTDSTGSLLLSFTVPESLTRWKFLSLAHTRNLQFGLSEKEFVTSKPLMIVPNPPRFIRQGDTLSFSVRITNLSDEELSGTIRLQLFNALTMAPCDSLVMNGNQSWSAGKGSGTAVTFTLRIPEEIPSSLLLYRVSATAGNFSDGEEMTLPVLSNRMMVTETMPLPVNGTGTFEFRMENLLQSGDPGKNATRKNHQLTLEFASNPAWYAVQALPSLNTRSYENADAVFTAFYSNTISAFLMNSNPRIKSVFESWKTLTPSALQSNLEKNQQLKSVLLQETPWVNDARNETERKQKLGQYFDLNNLAANQRDNLLKLRQLQRSSGGWTWFEGMPENRWVTQYIITGLGHLDQLGVTSVRNDREVWEMIVKGIRYLDETLLRDYENLKKYNRENLDDNHLTATQIQYLYARSYFMQEMKTGGTRGAKEGRIPDPVSGSKEAFTYFQKQAEKYWLKNDRPLQGMIALALNRLGNREIPALILKSLSEKALHSDGMGMWWASDAGYFWYQAPVETQALMIEAYDEIALDEKTVEELKRWLLKQKQTHDWKNPRATAEACYALLLRGTDHLSEVADVKITLGKEKINPARVASLQQEAGTGYFQLSWNGNEIKPEMGRITVSKSSKGTAWGALYWQYFENLDKIVKAPFPVKLEKQLFVSRNTPAGPVLESNASSLFKVGDVVVVRIVVSVDRDLEFVHLKDMRAAGMEPWFMAASGDGDDLGGTQEASSGYRYQGGLGYYQSMTDVAAHFFFDYLPKGTHVFEYKLKANAAGEYSNGITTLQCLYAPEFSAHSEGIRLRVEP